MLAERGLTELLDAVAAPTPAPGGGWAAATAGALGAALIEMSAQFAPDANAQSRAHALRAQLLELGEADARAYQPVLEALRVRDEDPARLRKALSQAAEPPLAIARAAAEVATIGAELARSRNPNLNGDATAGVLLAEAGCQAAARLVELNLAHATADVRVAEVGLLTQNASNSRVKALKTGYSAP